MNKEPKREPVTYLWDQLEWDFLKLMAEIAYYAASKYGSAHQYKESRLTGDKAPMNHVIEHYRQYLAGELHDHFHTRGHQLAAMAYNVMMEWVYLQQEKKKGGILDGLGPEREGQEQFYPSETYNITPPLNERTFVMYLPGTTDRIYKRVSESEVNAHLIDGWKRFEKEGG